MEEIQNDVYVEGFIAIGKDWDFLQASSPVIIKGLYDIYPLPWSSFKGISSLERKSICGIRLFEVRDCEIHVLITHQDEEHILDHVVICEAFKKAAQFAALKTGGSVTNKKYCQDVPVKVSPEDLASFGNHFQGKFQQLLQPHHLDAVLCVMQMGQEVPVADAILLLSRFQLDAADELVIHLARDFTRANTCLLWNRELVCNQLATPLKDFYVGYTGRVGNFEIETTNENAENGHPVAKMIRLSSNAFRYLEDNEPAPFKQCQVPAILQSKQEGTFDEEYVLLSMLYVERSIEWLEKTQLVEARIEVIYSVKSPQFHSLEHALDLFDLNYGADMQKMLQRFEFADFIGHTKDTLGVAVNTLTRLMEDFKRQKESSLGYFASAETLHLAAICELLISYGIYGTVDSSFDAVLVDKLQLVQSTFRNMEGNFMGFEFTNGVIEAVRGRLAYKGNLVLTKYVYGDVIQLVGEDSVQKLNAAFEAIKADSVNLSDNYNVIMQVLWKSVVCRTLEHLYGSATSNQDLGVAQFEARIQESNFKPKSCKEFASWVFNEVAAKLQSISSIIGQLRSILGPQRMDHFRNLFAKFVEKKLYETTLGLLYPVNTDYYFLILPLFRVDGVSFSTLSTEKQETMTKMYLMAYRKLFGSHPTYLPDPVPILKTYEKYPWKRDKTEEVWRALGHLWMKLASHVLMQPGSNRRPMSSSATKRLCNTFRQLPPPNE